MKTITLANQKGGVGKTTTAINLGSCLSEMGEKILIVDADPQGNASSGLNINIQELKHTLYDCFLQEISPKKVVKKIKDNLFVLPSNIHLSGIEVDIRDNPDKDTILGKILSKLNNEYDYILIDCPPSLGLMTINALECCNSVLIPLQCEYFALEGLSQLLKIINLVRDNLNSDIQIEGILLTMFDSRTKLSSQVVQDVRKHFPNNTFEIIIPRNIKLAESASFGKPVTEYDYYSSGALAYKSLAKEIISKDKD